MKSARTIVTIRPSRRLQPNAARACVQDQAVRLVGAMLNREFLKLHYLSRMLCGSSPESWGDVSDVAYLTVLCRHAMQRFQQEFGASAGAKGSRENFEALEVYLRREQSVVEVPPFQRLSECDKEMYNAGKRLAETLFRSDALEQRASRAMADVPLLTTV